MAIRAMTRTLLVQTLRHSSSPTTTRIATYSLFSHVPQLIPSLSGRVRLGSATRSFSSSHFGSTATSSQSTTTPATTSQPTQRIASNVLGETLVTAAESGNLATITYLLQKTGIARAYYAEAAKKATESGFVSLASDLLLIYKAGSFEEAFIHAVSHNDKGAFKALWKYRENINSTMMGKAFLAAVKHHNLDMAMTLMLREKGIPQEFITKAAQTAIALKNVECVALLLCCPLPAETNAAARKLEAIAEAAGHVLICASLTKGFSPIARSLMQHEHFTIGEEACSLALVNAAANGDNAMFDCIWETKRPLSSFAVSSALRAAEEQSNAHIVTRILAGVNS